MHFLVYLDPGLPSNQYLTEKDVNWDPSITLIPEADAQKSQFYCSMCRVALLTEEVITHTTPNHLSLAQNYE